MYGAVVVYASVIGLVRHRHLSSHSDNLHSDANDTVNGFALSAFVLSLYQQQRISQFMSSYEVFRLVVGTLGTLIQRLLCCCFVNYSDGCIVVAVRFDRVTVLLIFLFFPFCFC